MELYDIAVIGGGINGAGVARDAAGRGLKVLLAEQNDFASATSSASTKLIHGGLRYLEYYQFRLVAESLAEREVMLGIAPHIIWPLEFVLPHEKHLRPAWMIRAGLFLYDHIGGRSSLPKSRGVKLAPQGHGAGLKPAFTRGFAYYDAWVDDARLVVLTLSSARAHGASVLARTRCTGARREGDAWRVTLRQQASGKDTEVRARILVNAAGPWVKSVLERELKIDSPGRVRLVKGSHIVVPRIHDKRYAYILQNPDRRVIFMIPYEREFTLIGTTDVQVADGDLPPVISPDEVAYLCAAASRYSARAISTDQVAWSYSGVRPLYDDGKEDPSAITRDYVLLLDQQGPPLLSIFGGKITTYRKLAEHVLEKLARWIPARRPWTHAEALPGGDFGGRDFPTVLGEFRTRYPGLDRHWLARLLRRHGTLAGQILDIAKSAADLGENFGGGLYERELAYLVEHEWARTGEDVLWRRTKCGLHMSEAQRSRVAGRLAEGR
ncbi:MAG: glycerol-3-phosphate dehydrogenase [Betaproteobacteria bacterium RIFCSPLOWO2_12_FULL_62_13b]|nr:MAG: glycerol-3-phosphate dehydrogenase [Betaproteobacteria bacterium RIFCSPLOWO2_12_FULL_62_13b]